MEHGAGSLDYRRSGCFEGRGAGAGDSGRSGIFLAGCGPCVCSRIIRTVGPLPRAMTLWPVLCLAADHPRVDTMRHRWEALRRNRLLEGTVDLACSFLA